MKPSVEQAVSDRPVVERVLESWVNRELTPLLREIRSVLNMRGVSKGEADGTTLSAYATVWTSAEMPTDATWNVEAFVVGCAQAAGGAQHASYVLTGTFQSVAGTVSQLGATTSVASAESNAAIDARFGVADRTVYIEARDDGVGLMSWVAVVATTEVAL